MYNGDYNYFKLSIKTVMNFFTEMANMTTSKHKIALLMWHTKSLTDVLFPDIYLISDAVALSCS
jgi:hypothetical protein